MKPDEEMAKLFLDNHKKRNDSFIHDLFRGQFKSTLVRQSPLRCETQPSHVAHHSCLPFA